MAMFAAGVANWRERSARVLPGAESRDWPGAPSNRRTGAAAGTGSREVKRAAEGRWS